MPCCFFFRFKMQKQQNTSKNITDLLIKDLNFWRIIYFRWVYFIISIDVTSSYTFLKSTASKIFR